ncbi:MAG: DUF2207 domain-containing protein [Actinomycetales bacterium]|nr:DUF2207 domain-containing protein [Actinomycetales bacterium]
MRSARGSRPSPSPSRPPAAAGVALLALALAAVPLALGAPAAAEPAAPAPAAPGPAAPAAVEVVGGVDDFTFTAMTVDYTLDRDAADRSTLATTEELVAQFPDIDQNRGIRRAIPAVYQGHSTDLRIESVTDETGAPRSYDTSRDGDFLVLTIAVPEGQYVHGEQHYVIRYSQRDVTRHFEDTGRDEWYWDVNGTGWAQPFGVVDATVHLGPGLGAAYQQGACYFGPEGSTSRCDLVATNDGFGARVENLGPHENVTLALGFAPGTFAAAPFDLFAWVPPLVLIGLALMLASVVVAVLVRVVALRDSPGDGIVVAQYDPPDIDLFLAANLIGKSRKAAAATFVDLAVRRRIRLVEGEAPGLFGGTRYGLQSLDESGLRPVERTLLDVLFRIPSFTGVGGLFGGSGADGADGSVRWLTKNDQVLGRTVISITKQAALAARQLGWRRAGHPGLGTLVGMLGALGFGCLILSFVFGSESDPGLGFFLAMLGTVGGIWVVIGAVGLVAGRKPLSPEGARRKEYLEGLREYIQLAEADRLRVLQSVTGAERIAVDDRTAVVKIYEKLLPYAVLFGLEREWADVLGRYYDENPDWYAGSHVGAFNAAAFASSIGSMSTSVSTSYSGSASSSSSGGSGGGGSSGGGGGGGGGGGV